MVLYRIHTEDKNREAIVDTCADMFQNFSIYTGTGYWKGEEEPGLVIERLAEDTFYNRATMETLAESIKHLNNQEEVWLTVTPIVLVKV